MLNRDRPDDRAAGVGPPVRREQAGERGHEVHAAVVLDLTGERLGLARTGDDAELVPQPLHRGPGDGDRALQRVHRVLVAELVAHRAEQAGLRTDQLGAGVQQHEVAGAVGVLRFARVEADLTDRRRLLVTEVAGQRYDAGQRTVGERLAVHVRVRRRPDLRQHLPRDVEEADQLVVPVERLEVHQHRAAGVGHVGDVHAAVRRRRSGSTAARCRCCRTRRHRPRPPPGRRRRCPGSTAPCRPRSTSPAAGRPSAG